MLNRKENIGNNIPGSMLMLFFLFFMLSVSNHNSVANSNGNKHDISCENTVSQSNAIIKINDSVKVHQKTWVSEIKHPKSINPVYNSFFENRKTDKQISIQKDAVLNIGTLPAFIVYYHLFPTEKDDTPFLT